MTTLKVELRWIALIGITVWATPAGAQLPERFTNWQVLPKDISRPQLESTMRGFAFAPNVRRNYCHVEKPDGEQVKMDFAADEKETKKTARVML